MNNRSVVNYLDYMAYNYSCAIYGIETMSQDEYFKWKASFEYWYSNNWWNESWDLDSDI